MAADLQHLQPAVKLALHKALVLLQLHAVSFTVLSGYRSHAQQAALWRTRWERRTPTAAPGHSEHELGLAVDLRLENHWALGVRLMTQAGFRRDVPGDPEHYHFEGR